MAMSWIKSLILTALLLYVGAAAVMYLLQRQLMYFPSSVQHDPADLGLSGVAVETLTTSDGETLILWYSPAAPSQPTILFLHGNGGEIGDRAGRFRTYQEAGFGVAFLSWRGYGGSTGAPSEAGFLIDGRTAYQFLLDQGIADEAIVLVGESLGTGIAVQLAAEKRVGALVLGAPYSATADVAADHYPWLPVRILMKDQFRSIDHIGAVTAPILIQHGTADRVVPYKFGRRLLDAAPDTTTFIDLEGAGHDALFDAQTLANEVAFIRGVFAP